MVAALACWMGSRRHRLNDMRQLRFILLLVIGCCVSLPFALADCDVTACESERSTDCTIGVCSSPDGDCFTLPRSPLPSGCCTDRSDCPVANRCTYTECNLLTHTCESFTNCTDTYSGIPSPLSSETVMEDGSDNEKSSMATSEESTGESSEKSSDVTSERTSHFSSGESKEESGEGGGGGETAAIVGGVVGGIVGIVLLALCIIGVVGAALGLRWHRRQRYDLHSEEEMMEELDDMLLDDDGDEAEGNAAVVMEQDALVE